MPREKRSRAILLGLIVLSVVFVTYWWHSAAQTSGPNQQEYAVYTALLPHIAEGSKRRVIAQKRTISLSLPVYDSPPAIPVELRVKKTEDLSFPDFDTFCGHCAKDFVKKNLRAWPLESTLDYSSVPRAELAHDDSILVTLSRVGFNFWHTRAVVMFSADCSDDASMCLERGEAYLKRKGNTWIVDRVSGNTF
jgi:hypothetical protein